jgi:hypothetical protein
LFDAGTRHWVTVGAIWTDVIAGLVLAIKVEIVSGDYGIAAVKASSLAGKVSIVLVA